MYYFLCVLAVTDLVLSTATLPTILNNFWFNSREIKFSACLTQLYFIHSIALIESGILVAMALDRYVAICHPLRHSTVLNNLLVAKIGLAMMLRGAILVLPYPVLASQWPYCRTNVIPYTHCEHMDVVNLACADIRVSRYYGLFVLFSFYTPTIFGSLTTRFGLNIPQHIYILISNIYLLVPPMINPIIYGVRTEQIRNRLLQLLTLKLP
ncbi:olfactory receptor 52R1-like [Pelodiscus sinensis]|uniref:olfactory receptor 52R1-like n=1 Tax=Pelodiscus sinensis TaxID=13735 RepID=UPI003F6CBA6D